MSLAVVQGTEKAVNLLFVLAGVSALWNGLMRVVEKSGILKYLMWLYYPILKIIYPDAMKKKNGLNEIAMSMTANFFGLGNSATAISLSAMQKLDENNKHSKTPSRDMISFAVLNTCAINFVPTTLIALRYADNSRDPFEVILPVWICSVFCFLFAVLMLKAFECIIRRK